jgi:hypothetical protein
MVSHRAFGYKKCFSYFPIAVSRNNQVDNFSLPAGDAVGGYETISGGHASVRKGGQELLQEFITEVIERKDYEAAQLEIPGPGSGRILYQGG